MSAPSDIIDWHEAMQQCGDDEEFLRELLDDLRSEINQQLVNIAETIQNPQENPFHRIMRAAHVIKGAAANLMCGQLRTAAMHLETSAGQTHDAGGANAPQEMQAAVHGHYQSLAQAAQDYAAFLQSVGI